MREATNGKYPRFALWENVPGAFSSNKGEDFRIVLEEIAKIAEKDAVMPAVPKGGWAYADCFSGDGWSMAYRVFDAQHWGVPQRRRRIHLVADFAGECAEEILFEREGLRGDFTPCSEAWQGTAADAESGFGTEGSEGKCYGISSYASNAMLSDNPHSGIYEADTSRTLDLNGGNPACNQGGIAVVEPVIFDGSNITSPVNKSTPHPGDPCHTLHTDSRNIVVEPSAYESHPADSRVKLVETAAPTLTAKYAKLGSDGVIVCAATQQGGAEIRTGDKSPAITAAAGMSGNNQPYVSYSIDKAITTGGNCTAGGSCVNEEVSQTLTTDRPHAVAYQTEAVGIDTYNGSETGKVAATLGVNCGISTGRNGIMQQTFIIDSIGGQAEAAKETNISPTLKASHYKFPPVYAAGFCTEHSAQSGSVGYQVETSPTLRAGVVPAAVYDAREEGNGNTADVSSSSKAISLLGDTVAGTLKARDYKGVGRHDSLGSAVCVAGVDCRNGNESPELFPTLQAKPNGGQSLNFSGAVRQDYIVRRLTPTECARLQGFADNWGCIDEKESFSEEEYRFWLDVRNTHAAINGKQVKDYTEKQMLSWYNKLHTDSAEYKMWGNGIALPPALYVMQGIAEVIEATA